MQTAEELALSFTGECEPAELGLCANHKSPLFRAAKICLHVQNLTDLIRARDAEVAARALREWLATWPNRYVGSPVYEDGMTYADRIEKGETDA